MDGLTPWAVADVMKALRVSRSTVYVLVKAGKLRHARPGGCLRFKPEWVEEYIRSVTAGPPLPEAKPALLPDGTVEVDW